MIAVPRRESCHYRITWDRNLLGWRLTYDGKTWAFISAYLPGRPQMGQTAAKVWADQLLGTPQPWTPDGNGYQAVPAP